mgnify:CR=1 FL=1
MSHLPVLPVIIPLSVATILLLARSVDLDRQRIVSLVGMVVYAVVAAMQLVAVVDGGIFVYKLGNWAAPYGIVVVLDQLSALMIALTAVLALPVTLASIAGTDGRGRHFHAFLHLQVAGLSGAFLTGDVFNLFVFFEILLLASYVLLLHGGGFERARSGFSYVSINLAGSALFLVALGLIYGVLGTLNLADIAILLPQVAPSEYALVRTAMILLAVVFVLKAAVLPLGFWLPHVYSSALLPVAALFVIMTKVGIYALLRVSTIGFAAAPITTDLMLPWLPWLAIGTIVVGGVGSLAARNFAVVIANLVLISSGTMLLGISLGTVPAISATLFYLIHTTVVTGGLFLLTHTVSEQRGTLGDLLEKGPRLGMFLTLGAAYLVLGIAASGAPPLSGFLGKVMVMQAVSDTPWAGVAWTVLLVAGFAAALVLARAASAFFWEPGRGEDETSGEQAAGVAISRRVDGTVVAAVFIMVIAAPLLVVSAATVSTYARAAATQLNERQPYIEAVLGREVKIERERRP